MTFELEESQRQAVVLAIAELALSRPGWDHMLREISQKFQGEEMFEDLKRINADRVKQSHHDLFGNAAPPREYPD